MRDTLDFSFSGVKTALLHRAQDQGIYPQEGSGLGEERINALVAELAAAFQASVVDVMVVKLLRMAEQYHARGLVLGGGVTANAWLRQEITRLSPLPVVIPPPVLCTDNGAMIAASAFFQYQRGEQYGLELEIDPSLHLG
jgi:N6-L-threonylcarbamoyladenine synthase